MKLGLLATMALVGATWHNPAHATPQYITTDDVLEIFARLPACEGCKLTSRGHYERNADAKEIAEAIAATVDGTLLGDLRLEASLMATYAAFESSVHRCPHGDLDHKTGQWRAWGAWQEWYAGWKVACTPSRAASFWWTAAHKAMGTCWRYPIEERLAPLASGSCQRARGKVRRRFAVAEYAARVTFR